MTNLPEIETYTDFEHIYNLEDPRPYFRALRPVDYRMPGVTCDYLLRHQATLRRHFGKEKLRVLDLACGFGTNGALLKHDLSLAELYEFYERDAKEPILEADPAFFAARRAQPSTFEVGGIDIAENALDYGKACGFMDEIFAENLIGSMPSEGLSDFLAETDIIFEVGALLDILLPVIKVLLDASGANARPWLLLGPRRDVEDEPLWAMARAQGYRVETVNRAPIRYRRLLGEKERKVILEKLTDMGRDPATGISGDFFVLDLVLARPEEDARALPLSSLPFA